MLELKKIKKDYPAGDGIVHALKGIDLQFRKNEFVSILGPSGCGKTTLLNIIGGLDHYTSGDLIINGKSTKDFGDREWDTYRNHSIGFVFQSYNLIPHQSVLQNVELALTLTGVSRTERKRRAKEALEQVGLGNQLNKKPSQMSGGQMQRVAIARALVNNPDIILADEPTGALDTETSVQVMDILKEISKDKLIIMVTHNPELAEKYSTRIIRILDGELTDDTHPLDDEEYLEIRAQERAAKLQREKEKKNKKNKKKKREKMPSMSLMTSFSLSLKNLIAKGGRTLLTSFAGSIGIIGIALILAVSQGLTAYIDAVQEETLSSYPITLESTTLDMGSLMETFMDIRENIKEHEKDAIYSKPVIYNMIDALNSLETTENDLKSFKEFLEKEYASSEGEGSLKEAINGIQYTYNLDMQVFTQNVDGTVIRSDTQKLLSELMMEYMGMDMATMGGASSMGAMGMGSPMMSMGGGAMTLWQEMLPGNNGEPVNDLLTNQYDLVYGSWPNSYNEIVLVVDRNNELADLTLYALGLVSEEYMGAIMESAVDGEDVELETHSWTYEEICNMDFRVVFNADCYTYDQLTDTYTDMRETEAGMKYLYDNGLNLKVTGIIRPSETAESTMLSGSIGYTSLLTKYVIEEKKDAPAIQAQLKNPSVDIFTNLPFEENTGKLTDAEKEKAFRDYMADLSDAEKAITYVKIMSIPSEELLESSVTQAMAGVDRATIEATLTQVMSAQLGMSENDIADYLSKMSDEDIFKSYEQLIREQVKAQYAMKVAQQMASLPAAQKVAAFDAALPNYTTEQCATYYDEVLEFSESTYEQNLVALGYLDIEDPSSINLYASSFENKEIIEQAIADYNDTVDELHQITYTDYIGIMMSSITTIIDAITYVLIAFVAISLVVSSIMIAVITLISVQERTKEIGILRAMGASKHNVSVMFNAETVIIGFASGALGVLVSVLLCIPINAIIHELTGIYNLNAFLPVNAAFILVAISVILNLFSGFIPAKSAARKDPVVALRSE